MTLTIISAVLAIAATVLAFIFIVPEKKRATLNKPLQILHDTLNFKFLIIEKILQAFYIFVNAFVIIAGVFSLFRFEKTGMEFVGLNPETFEPIYDYSYSWFGWSGLLMIVLGPIVIRIAYEFLMMSVLLVKNVIQLNSKTKNQNEDNGTSMFDLPEISFPKKAAQPAQTAPVNTYEAPVAPAPAAAPAVADQPKFCKICGSPTVDGHCPQGHM